MSLYPQIEGALRFEGAYGFMHDYVSRSSAASLSVERPSRLVGFVDPPAEEEKPFEPATDTIGLAESITPSHGSVSVLEYVGDVATAHLL